MREFLQGPAAWQVRVMPRLSRPPAAEAGHDGTADLGAAQRLAALTSAFHAGGPVAFGWVREQTGGPVRILVAGTALAAGQDAAGHTLLTVPAGARAVPAGRGGLAGLLDPIGCWAVVGGTSDWLLAGEARRGAQHADVTQPGTGPGPAGRVVRPGLDDGLLAVWPGPFGWLVVAEPVTAPGLAQLSEETSVALGMTQGYDSPDARIAIRRLEGRHGELRQAVATGLWRVRVLAGGTSGRGAAQVAGLVCASVDLDGLPYALAPLPGAGTLAQALARGEAPTAGCGEQQPVPAAAFTASTTLLAALTCPPAREVAGVRFALRPEFDVTPEPAARTGPGIGLGTVLDGNRMPAGTVSLPLASLNRHVFVCGATGAGKSQTIRGLLESATRAGIPWLVVEPAKAEYQLMAARLPEAGVVTIVPGQPDGIPAGLNPLEPSAGPGGTRFPLQAHADLVRALFLAAFDAEEPFPQVLAAALTRCYTSVGWDLALGEPAAGGTSPGYPSLEDLQDAAAQVVTEIGYGREITDNVRGFVQVRLGSLRLGTAGRFLDGGHPLDLPTVMNRNVVLQIEDAGDDADKAFLMGTVLIRLAEFLRMGHREHGPGAPGLRHLTVIEEAHRLLRHPQGRPGPAAHAVEMFAALLAEVRAYGEGLIIAEQIPAKLIPDVIKNTAVKITHRLPAADDRQAVGATMNITGDQSQYLVTLSPGEAAVFTDGMDYPLLVQMPDGSTRESTAPAGPPPSALVTSRSGSCGPDCRQAPCTVRQIRAAQKAAGDDPRITLWAELSVLAHLTGWTMPMPAPEFAMALRGLDTRLRDCALSCAVDTATTARAAAMTGRVSPPDLAAHVTAAMRTALDDNQWRCERTEPAYLALCYRWTLVLDSLKAYHRENTGAGRHPSSGEWQAVYGRPVPGDTCARQLAAVQRWYDADQRDPQLTRAVAFGTRAKPAIETAVGARRADEDWEQRLTGALTAFRDCGWPPEYLRPAAPS